MNVELAALEANHTWELQSLPPGKKIVGCKWLFKVKYFLNGELDCYKARLVAKGFTQTEGLHYFESFAPVVEMSTLRILLTLEAKSNWFLKQLDVTNAFLHGDLSEEVFMRIPPGYAQLSSIPAINDIKDLSGWVCKHRKSIYGLRQAPKCWFTKIYKTLLQYGFV